MASTAKASTHPAWLKPVLISSIVLVCVVIVIVVLYFLNVLMPRYACDATTGKCVGKYNGTYKNNTCDNACATVINLTSLNNISNNFNPNGQGNDGKRINLNYLIKLGEFKVNAAATTDKKCPVNVNAGYQVGIFDGTGDNSMIASLLVIDIDAWNKDPSHQFPWGIDQIGAGNTVVSTGDSDNIFNVLVHDNVVRAGQVPASTVIDESNLPKFKSDNAFHDVTLKGDFDLPSGLYWVVAFLGMSTNGTVKVQKMRNSDAINNTVTLAKGCVARV